MIFKFGNLDIGERSIFSIINNLTIKNFVQQFQKLEQPSIQ